VVNLSPAPWVANALAGRGIGWGGEPSRGRGTFWQVYRLIKEAAPENAPRHGNSRWIRFDSICDDGCFAGAGLKAMRRVIRGTRLPGPPIDLPPYKAAPLAPPHRRPTGLADPPWAS
jgi:hypothetical protein